MKKIISILLVLVMVLSLAACGNNAGNNSNGDNEGSTAEGGATATETALSNTAKLLKVEKKLTIGYIGGSITLGSSAAQYLSGSELNKEANIQNSWVNRTSAYFATNYPDAVIETVNVGISNTQTNFAIYRLADHLMNTNGHDMPDLVFIEFTSNDWNSGEELKVEIESLFRNIYAANPYAEIVVLSTNRDSSNASRKLYRELCEEYGIPFVDVGTKLRSAIREKSGATKENGPYFYTVDDLHPSAEGYKLYTDLIIETIEPLLKTKLDSDNLYNNFENLRASVCSSGLISNPKKTFAKDLTYSGNAAMVEQALKSNFYGTDFVQEKVDIVPSYLEMNNGSTFTANFSGTTFGVIVGHTKNSYKFSYRIDGGEWKTEEQTSHLYEHTQVKILEHFLSEGNHTIEFKCESDGLRLGGLLTNEK